MRNWRIGVIISLTGDLKKAVEEARAAQMTTCQLICWDAAAFTEEKAAEVREAMADFHVSSLWAGWPGPVAWDFWDAPLIDGLVPSEYRVQRVEALKKAADFAAMIGVGDIVTHVGFVPENPANEEYIKIVWALRDIAAYCKKKNVVFNFETGQETPVTLKRCIHDIGAKNLGINLDPANLLMYGKGNPVDAVGVFGEYVRSLHIKDGEYPTDGRALGRERAVGEGMVDFKALLTALNEKSFEGTLIIEREIEGPQQSVDVIKARDMLHELLADL